MNLRKFVGPDGMVELKTKDGETIRRWPIDARQMIVQGGAKPTAAQAAAQAPAPAPAATRTSSEADEE